MSRLEGGEKYTSCNGVSGTTIGGCRCHATLHAVVSRGHRHSGLTPLLSDRGVIHPYVRLDARLRYYLPFSLGNLGELVTLVEYTNIKAA